MLRTGQMILMQALKRHVFHDYFRLEMIGDQDIRKEYFELLP